MLEEGAVWLPAKVTFFAIGVTKQRHGPMTVERQDMCHNLILML